MMSSGHRPVGASGQGQPAAPASGQSSALVDGASELAAAEKLIRGGRIGLVGERVRPFTRQIQNVIRRQYPDEADFYADADDTQRRVTQKYLRMRLLTLACFLLFLTAVCTIAWLYIAPLGGLRLFGGLPKSAQPFATVGLAAAVLALMWVVRWRTRSWGFVRLEREAENFSHRVVKQLRAVQMDVVSVFK